MQTNAYFYVLRYRSLFSDFWTRSNRQSSRRKKILEKNYSNFSDLMETAHEVVPAEFDQFQNLVMLSGHRLALLLHDGRLTFGCCAFRVGQIASNQRRLHESDKQWVRVVRTRF